MLKEISENIDNKSKAFSLLKNHPKQTLKVQQDNQTTEQNIVLENTTPQNINNKNSYLFQKIKNNKEINLNSLFSSKIESENHISLPVNAAKNVIKKNSMQKIEKIESFLDQVNTKVEILNPDTKDIESVFTKADKKINIKTLDYAENTNSNLKETNINDKNFNVFTGKSSVKTLPSYVIKQVGRNLIRAANNGTKELSLQLKPPELGRLIMKIDNTNNNIKVSIITENQAAKDILLSHSSELRSVLSNNGINLDLDVDMGQNFRQSMADARQQAGFNSKNKDNKKTNLNIEKEMQKINKTESINNDGTLHLVA